MATVAVAFDGTRVSNNDATTGWINEGANPTSEPDFVYQGTASVSCKIKTAEIGVYYTNATGIDFSTNNMVFVAKIVQTNKDSLDGNGFRIKIGSANTACYVYNVFSATTYPAIGGWQVVPINPNITQWRDATIGSANLQAVGTYGFRADCGATAKAENSAMDAIDVINANSGLTLTRGDSTDANGTFDSFVTYDEGTVTNRYGIVQTRDGILYVNGKLNIGNSTVNTEFTDQNQVLVFPDHRVANGFCGINFDCSNTGSTTTITSCVFNGKGDLYTSDDTRPDYNVVSTDGALSVLTSVFDGFANWRFQNQVIAVGSSFLNGLFANGAGANLQSTVWNGCTGAANASYLYWDDNDSSGSKLNSASFTRGTTNTHAIRLVNTTMTAITLTDVTLSGYNTANGENDSAIHVMKSAGSLTINITGGTTPTILTEGATVSVVAGSVTVAVHAANTTAAVGSARVFLRAADGTGPFPYQNTVTITNSGTTATVAHASHGMATADKVVIDGASHWENNGVFPITVANTTHYTYTMSSDPGSSPTGSITSTFVALSGLTDGSGDISTSRVYSANQAVTGWIRKSSGSPYYKTALISGEIDSSDGYSATGLLVLDE
jgi:hypothetical protein